MELLTTVHWVADRFGGEDARRDDREGPRLEHSEDDVHAAPDPGGVG